jgi:hypothetical protein
MRPRLRLQRRLARAKRGSNRRQRVKTAIARLKAREADRRKDWVEKTSTDLARRFDVIRVEDLKIKNMVGSARGTVQVPGKSARAKAGLNRSIHAAGWGRPRVGAVPRRRRTVSVLTEQGITPNNPPASPQLRGLPADGASCVPGRHDAKTLSPTNTPSAWPDSTAGKRLRIRGDQVVTATRLHDPIGPARAPIGSRRERTCPTER